MKLVVVGARADGSAHLIIDLVADGAPHEVVAFLDDNPALWGTTVCGVPVLGPSADAARAIEVGAEGAVVFVADPHRREHIAGRMREAGLQLPTMVHPRAYIAPSATIGPGTVVGAMATISTGATVGALVIVAPTAMVSHNVEVGDLTHLSPGCCLGGRSRVGRRVFVGLGATVVSERSVGDDAAVWAGGVVTVDVPPGTTVAGVPAKPIQRTA